MHIALCVAPSVAWYRELFPYWYVFPVTTGTWKGPKPSLCRHPGDTTLSGNPSRPQPLTLMSRKPSTVISVLVQSPEWLSVAKAAFFFALQTSDPTDQADRLDWKCCCRGWITICRSATPSPPLTFICGTYRDKLKVKIKKKQLEKQSSWRRKPFSPSLCVLLQAGWRITRHFCASKLDSSGGNNQEWLPLLGITDFRIDSPGGD